MFNVILTFLFIGCVSGITYLLEDAENGEEK